MSLAFVFLLSIGAPAPGEVLTLSEVRARALAAAAADPGPAYARTRLAEVRASRRPVVAATVDVSAAPGGEFFDVLAAPDPDNPDASRERVRVSAVNALEDGLDGLEPQLRYGASMGLDWNLFDFGRTSASLGAAEAELRAARLEEALQRANLIEAVDLAYLSWLSAFAERDLRRASLARAEAAVADRALDVEAGAAAPTEVEEAELRVVAARLRSLDADEALADARRQLEGAAGIDLPRATAPDLAWLEDPSVEAAAGLPRSRALAARVEAAEAQAIAVSRGKRARLLAEASAGLRGQELTLIPVYRGGLELRVPVTDGGARKARVERAEAETDALRVRLQDAQAAEARSARHRDAGLDRAELRVELSLRYLELSTAALDDARAEAGSPGAETRIQQAWSRVEQAQAALLAARVGRAERLLAQSRSVRSSPPASQ